MKSFLQNLGVLTKDESSTGQVGAPTAKGVAVVLKSVPPLGPVINGDEGPVDTFEMFQALTEGVIFDTDPTKTPLAEFMRMYGTLTVITDQKTRIEASAQAADTTVLQLTELVESFLSDLSHQSVAVSAQQELPLSRAVSDHKEILEDLKENKIKPLELQLAELAKEADIICDDIVKCKERMEELSVKMEGYSKAVSDPYCNLLDTLKAHLESSATSSKTPK